MKFHLKNLKDDESIRLEESLDPSALDIDIGVMHFPQEIHVEAEAWRSGDDLTVTVHAEGERKMTCSLCLEEFNNVFEKDITLHYDIKGLDSITIDPDVREEILLEHPIRVLCRPDCKGLCPTCGKNLNEGPCRCKK